MAFPRPGRLSATTSLLLAGSMAALPIASAYAASAAPSQRLFSAAFINRHSNLCLSVDGAGLGNGARLLQWDCGPRDNQQWNLTATSDGYYQIRSADSGKCVSVSDAGTRNGVPILQWDCGTRDNQQWRLVQRDHGFFSLVARHSHKCVSIPDASTQNGAPAIQWDCGAQHERHWLLD